MNKTSAAVLLFIVVLLFAASNAFADAKIALGKTAFNSSNTVGEIGWEFRDWEITAGLIGEGETKRGDQGVVPVYSFSKLVKPDWSFLGAKNYYRIGVAYVDGSPLVGNTNFRLGVGLAWKVASIEYVHYSSAGIHDTNTGIDIIMLRMNLPF